MTIIYAHPEIAVADIQEICTSRGLRLRQDENGHYWLEPLPSALLPNGSRYVRSEETDIRKTFDRAKAERKQWLP